MDHAPAHVIAPEAPAHAAALERVLDRAFGPGRFAKTSERVREQGARHRLDLSRVALRRDAPIGLCRMHDISVGGAPALFLGPLAVDPAHQQAGLGAALVEAALTAARIQPARAVLAVGAANFFAPFGFVPIPEGRVTMPGPVDPRRLLWLPLKHDAAEKLAGAVGPPMDLA